MHFSQGVIVPQRPRNLTSCSHHHDSIRWCTRHCPKMLSLKRLNKTKPRTVNSNRPFNFTTWRQPRFTTTLFYQSCQVLQMNGSLSFNRRPLNFQCSLHRVNRLTHLCWLHVLHVLRWLVRVIAKFDQVCFHFHKMFTKTTIFSTG